MTIKGKTDAYQSERMRDLFNWTPMKKSRLPAGASGVAKSTSSRTQNRPLASARRETNQVNLPSGYGWDLLNRYPSPAPCLETQRSHASVAGNLNLFPDEGHTERYEPPMPSRSISGCHPDDYLRVVR